MKKKKPSTKASTKKPKPVVKNKIRSRPIKGENDPEPEDERGWEDDGSLDLGLEIFNG